MHITPNTAYTCAITWHDNPTHVEYIDIFVGELPLHYRHTAIDEQIFFEMPLADFFVGYDAGEWRIVEIITARWYLTIHT
jgi:hypothetical protein